MLLCGLWVLSYGLPTAGMRWWRVTKNKDTSLDSLILAYVLCLVKFVLSPMFIIDSM